MTEATGVSPTASSILPRLDYRISNEDLHGNRYVYQKGVERAVAGRFNKWLDAKDWIETKIMENLRNA